MSEDRENRGSSGSTTIDIAFVEQLLDAAPVVLFTIDRDGVITLSRGSALAALGLGQDELVGRNVFDLYTHESRIADAASAALRGETVTAQLTLDGVIHNTRFAPLWGSAGDVQGIVGVATDVTAQVEAQRSLEYLAHFDALTGMPNRNSLRQRAQEAISRVPIVPMAVAIIGLDRFREVNQTFGYEVGDLAIREIATRFQATFADNPEEYCARAAGDEFAVVVSGRDARTLRERVYGRVQRIFDEPVLIRDQPLAIEASTGIAFFPGHGDDAEKLIRRADTAMHAAKDSGTGGAVYDRFRDEPKINNIQLVADLRKAIEANEVESHFQPQFALSTGRIMGAEALFRWSQLPRYQITVGELMIVAERSGIIYALDGWVLNNTVETSTALQREGYALRMAVNVSARSMQRPALADEIASLAEIWGVPGANLCVEITETAMVHNHRQLRHTCTALREAGIGVAIDDFGTGNSSLVYLKDLGVSQIKIDIAFVKGLANDPTDQTLVKSVIDMGNNLGVRVIAEGVEDAAAMEMLREMGCHEVQGFHTGRPMPLPDLINLLKT